ncbi:hypothetical protein V5G24_11715 [Xanthobacter sp. VTT E-85241]|uniref:hypothetical protein n=1 Tax=Roseixanthobacter finlandensis TaxID=3119922 RepID=UPI00372723D2
MSYSRVADVFCNLLLLHCACGVHMAPAQGIVFKLSREVKVDGAAWEIAPVDIAMTG